MLLADADCGDNVFELDVLRELSHARTNPKAVAESLRKRLPHFKGNDYFPPDREGKGNVVTKEGQAAVRDAINYLEQSNKLPQLADACAQGLRLAAEDHLLDLGSHGTTGHQGADNSSSSERMKRYGAWSGKCGECMWFGRMGTSAKQLVEDLIVDDGVPSRGHRLGIYDPKFHVAGIRMGSHKTFGACCVIDLATAYVDNEENLIRRVTAGPPVVAAGKQPVKTQWQNLGRCPGCKELIHGGAVIEAMGHKWHRDCFTCQADGCGQSLRGVPYQEHGGMPFCKNCYYSQFGCTCHGCGEKIHGGVLKAAGHTWHKECYECKAATDDGYRHAPATRKAAPASRATSGARPKTPPHGGTRATPPPKAGTRAMPPKAGGRARTPPPEAKGGALPKIPAGRGAVMKASPKTMPKTMPMGSAKRTVDYLAMSYADLE